MSAAPPRTVLLLLLLGLCRPAAAGPGDAPLPAAPCSLPPPTVVTIPLVRIP